MLTLGEYDDPWVAPPRRVHRTLGDPTDRREPLGWENHDGYTVPRCGRHGFLNLTRNGRSLCGERTISGSPCKNYEDTCPWH